MDIAKFRRRIQTTILLIEEQKAYLFTQAKTYTPETRKQIIEVLNKHEKNLSDKNDEILQIIQKERSLEAQKYASVGDTVHEQEVEQALKEVNADLKKIETIEIQGLQKTKPQIKPQKKNSKIFNKTIISLLILIIMMLIFFAIKSNESRDKVHMDDSKPSSKPKLKPNLK